MGPSSVQLGKLYAIYSRACDLSSSKSAAPSALRSRFVYLPWSSDDAVRIGLYFFPTAGAAPIAKVARAAEAAGFESLFVPEHSHLPAHPEALRDPRGGLLPDRYLRIFDPFVALAAAATATSRLLIGTAVCVLTQRDMIVTAKAAATLDQLSEGRLVFGVGSGWNRHELATYGIDPMSRGSRLRESVAAIRVLWTADAAEYHGDHVAFAPLLSYPKPVQRPGPPILLAGEGELAWRRVLEYGDGWLPTHRGGPPGPRIAAFREAASAAGVKVPGVTFIARDAEAETIDDARRAGVDRLLLPLPTGSIVEVEGKIDAWSGVLGD